MSKYLITGAAGGMGQAVAKALTASGDEVWGIDIHEAAEYPLFHMIRADLCDMVAVDKAEIQIRQQTEELDAIIHMAGIYDLDSLTEIPEESFVRDFNVNVFAAYRINRTFIPMLKKNGRIIIISSELAPLNPLPFTGIYAVTKLSLEKYAAALRMEIQMLDHPVIVIRPGAVRTDMIPESCRKLDEFCDKTVLYHTNADRFRKIVSRIEARNVPPERVAALISKALNAKHPKSVYKLNRNPLLLLLNALPQKIQLWIIRKILS